MARSRLSLLPKQVTIEQGAVGDCYLLAIIDCILNEGEDGRAKLQHLITELPGGSIEIRLPSNERSREDLLTRRFLNVYYKDPETHHDVFTFSVDALDTISSDTAGVKTNALLVKILERIVPCYFDAESGMPESKNDTAWWFSAHNHADRHAGLSSPEFVAKLLGIHASLALKKEEIIQIKTMWPNAPIYIGMNYGRADVYGRPHSRHALRLQDISSHGSTQMFNLINPWDNHSKIESYEDVALESRNYYAYLLNVSEEKFNLLTYLLEQYKSKKDVDPSHAEGIMSHATYLFKNPLLINSIIGNSFLYSPNPAPEALCEYVESFKETIKSSLDESKKDILAIFHLYSEYQQLSIPSFDNWIYRSTLNEKAIALLRTFEDNFGAIEKEQLLTLMMSDVNKKIQESKKAIEQEITQFIQSTIDDLNSILPISYEAHNSPNKIAQHQSGLLDRLRGVYSLKILELKEKYPYQLDSNALKIRAVYTEVHHQVEGQALIATIKCEHEYEDFLFNHHDAMRLFETILLHKILIQRKAFAASVGEDKAAALFAPFIEEIRTISIERKNVFERKSKYEIQHAIEQIKKTPTFFQKTSNLDSILEQKEHLHAKLSATVRSLRTHLSAEIDGSDKTINSPHIQDAIQETRALIDQAAENKIKELSSPSLDLEGDIKTDFIVQM